MPPPAWDQMKTELANTNRKVNPSDRWRTTSWFHQPLSVVFPPQIQHSSVLFKLGETRSAFLLYFSLYVLRPSYFLCWVASHQKTWTSCAGNHKAGDTRRFNLHPHLCNENTTPGLANAALHHSVCTWQCWLCVCEFQPLWVWVCICVCLAVQSQSDTQSAALETMSLCCRAGDCGALNADDALTRVLGVSFWQMDSPAEDCIITFVANK